MKVTQDRSLWHTAADCTRLWLFFTMFYWFLIEHSEAPLGPHCLTLVLCPPGDERLLLHRHWVLGSRPWGQTDGSLCGGAFHRPAAGAGGRTETRGWRRGGRTQREGLSSRRCPDSFLLHCFFLTHLLLHPAGSTAKHRWYRGIPWFPGSHWFCGVIGRCHYPTIRLMMFLHSHCLSNFFTVRPYSERRHSVLTRGAALVGGDTPGVCDTGRYLMLLLYIVDFKPGTDICEWNISGCRNRTRTSPASSSERLCIFCRFVYVAVNASLHGKEREGLFPPGETLCEWGLSVTDLLLLTENMCQMFLSYVTQGRYRAGSISVRRRRWCFQFHQMNGDVIVCVQSWRAFTK